MDYCPDKGSSPSFLRLRKGRAENGHLSSGLEPGQEQEKIEWSDRENYLQFIATSWSLKVTFGDREALFP